MKWGAPISNGGPGTTAPLLATALLRKQMLIIRANVRRLIAVLTEANYSFQQDI